MREEVWQPLTDALTAYNRGNSSRGSTLFQSESARNLAFYLAKQFTVAKMIGKFDEFCAHFSQLFKSSQVQPATTRELGDHLRDFIQKGEQYGTPLQQAANNVISSIKGFEALNVSDYNKKAGMVTPKKAIDSLRMKCRSDEYSPRSEVLR